MIERVVHLVSAAGGRATLFGNGRGECVVRVEVVGVALEAVTVVAGTAQFGEGGHRQQQEAVRVRRDPQRTGGVVLCGCDLLGMVAVYGTAELRECVVHSSSLAGVHVCFAGSKVVLFDTTVECCVEHGVNAWNNGVASLQGCTVRACGYGNYRAGGGTSPGNAGRIEGVAPELIDDGNYY